MSVTLATKGIISGGISLATKGIITKVTGFVGEVWREIKLLKSRITNAITLRSKTHA